MRVRNEWIGLIHTPFFRDRCRRGSDRSRWLQTTGREGVPTENANQICEMLPLSKNPVGLGFLDLEFHVVVPPQGSALAGILRRRNLHQLRLAFERLRYVNVELVTKALGINTAVLLDIGKK